VYFVDERFGYGTVEEYGRKTRASERPLSGRFYRLYAKRPLDIAASLVGLIL
jgi:hypothetical protein